MEEQKKKIITVSLFITAAMTGLVVKVLLESAAAAWGIAAKYYAMDIVKHGVPVTAGLALFLYLQFNVKIQTWADEVVLEISKVVWPSNKDTKAMTITCCVMLAISSVVLWFFDVTSTALVKILLNM